MKKILDVFRDGSGPQFGINARSVLGDLGVNVLTAFPDKRKVLDLPKLVKNMGNAVRVALRDLGEFGPPE